MDTSGMERAWWIARHHWWSNSRESYHKISKYIWQIVMVWVQFQMSFVCRFESCFVMGIANVANANASKSSRNLYWVNIQNLMIINIDNEYQILSCFYLLSFVASNRYAFVNMYMMCYYLYRINLSIWGVW